MAVNSFNAQNPPVTTKGDLFTFSTIPTRLGVGANNTVLTADSAQATGLKWAAPSGAYTLISTTNLTSGSSVSITSIPSTYRNLWLYIRNFFPSMNGTELRLQFNADTNTRYSRVNGFTNLGNVTANSLNLSGGSTTQIGNTAGQNQSLIVVKVLDYANTATAKLTESTFFGNSNTSGGWTGSFTLGGYNQTGAISSIQLLPDQGTFNGGTALLYGEL